MKPLAAAAPAPQARRLPVIVLTGFLGSGKTTLINQILTADHGVRLGVIVHEYGDVGIDDALVARRGDEFVELVNGCLYCGDRGALPNALQRLAGGDLDAILIETSGLADPLGVVEALTRGGYAREPALEAVVTLVDCANFDANLRHATAAYQQLVAADLLLLTKADLVPETIVDTLCARLRTVNSQATLVVGDHTSPPVDLLLGAWTRSAEHVGPRFSPATFPGPDGKAPSARSHRHEIESVLLTAGRPLDQARFHAWTQALPARVIRAKGIVRLHATAQTTSGTYLFQRVGVREDLYAAPPAAYERLTGEGALIVLFGSGLDRAGLAAGLRDCAAAPSAHAGSSRGRRP
jgi:G3E family GTPase